MTQLADEIEALAKEATQAPWDIETESKSRGTYLVRRLSENTFIPAAQTLSLQESANAALIVALVNNHATIVSALRERDALKAEVERLRGALEPFAKGANAFDTITPGGSGRPCPDAATYCEGAEVTVGDFRRARAALGGGG